MINATIGDRIRELRNGKGYTQEQLAKEINHSAACSRQTLVAWENGQRGIPTDGIIALSKELGVTCDYILCGVEAPYVDFCAETGLSYDTVTQLKGFIQSHKGFHVDKLLNALLNSGASIKAAAYYQSHLSVRSMRLELEKFGIDSHHDVEYWKLRGITLYSGEQAEVQSKVADLREKEDFYLFRALKMLESCLTKGEE